MEQDKLQRQVTKIVKKRLDLNASLSKMTLDDLLTRVNPYYEAVISGTAAEFIHRTVSEYVVRSEKTSFGHVLEDIAVFLSPGLKSPAHGIDIDQPEGDSIRNLISMKSGKDWGNHQSHSGQLKEFDKAKSTIKESDSETTVNTVMGICYGNVKTVEDIGGRSAGHRGYADYQVCGQNLWYLISHDMEMYTRVFDAMTQVKNSVERKQILEKHISRLTESFIERYGEDVEIALKLVVKQFSQNWTSADLVNKLIAPEQRIPIEPKVQSRPQTMKMIFA